MTAVNGPRNPAEHAAMETWLSGSADTTGMLLAVRRALQVQREEIAQAIEAEIVQPLDDGRGYASQGRNANMHYAARIARQHGKEG